MEKIETQGKICPECGAKGEVWDGEHETTTRQSDTGNFHIVDVGWKCGKCGHEWGFETPALEPVNPKFCITCGFRNTPLCTHPTGFYEK